MYTFFLLQLLTTAQGLIQGSRKVEKEAIKIEIDPLREENNSSGPWSLVELSGNTSTILNRYSEFVLYLKLNLASLSGCEFDEVEVNGLSYTPTLLINTTISNSANLTVLRSLAETNETILEFSGHVFRIISFTTQQDILTPRTHEVFSSSVSDNLVLVVAGVVLLLLFCFLLCAFVSFGISNRAGSKTTGEEGRPIFYSTVSDFEEKECSQDTLKPYLEDFDIPDKRVEGDSSISSIIFTSQSTVNHESKNNLYSSTPIPKPKRAKPNTAERANPTLRAKPNGGLRTKPNPPPRTVSLGTLPRISRPMSVPAPCHIYGYDYRPTSSSSFNNFSINLSRDVIEEDVSYILSTLEET